MKGITMPIDQVPDIAPQSQVIGDVVFGADAIINGAPGPAGAIGGGVVLDVDDGAASRQVTGQICRQA